MLMQSKFNYQDHQIKVTLGMLGQEKVYLNDKLVSRNNSWKLRNEHLIDCEGETLTVIISVDSLRYGRVKVALMAGETLIGSDLHTASLDGMNKHFAPTAEEEAWMKEVEMPMSITSLMYTLYAALIAYSLSGAFEFDWLAAPIMVLVGLVFTGCIGYVIKDSFSALKAD